MINCRQDTTVAGCKVICTRRFSDNRGHFEEILGQDHQFDFKQINSSRSSKNVVRGLHIVPFAKLVTCIIGRIFDVCVDTRKNSPTYLKWFGTELNEENKKQLYIPEDCAHGFMSLDYDNLVIYSQTGYYDPKVESSIHWQSLDISWPEAPFHVVSPKDEVAPKL